MDLSFKEGALKAFQEKFGTESLDGVKCYFAPGRVNLIGEHTDYNGGHVFPCALTIGTYAAAKKRDDRKLRFYSVNLDKIGVVETSLDEFRPLKDDNWTSYLKGVMWAFEKRGFKMDKGIDLVIYGNIPNGSGLSSSASIEVLTGFILRDLYGFDVTNVDLAVIGQDAENNYCGMNCGIMDQFASAMGKKDNAIFLDCATLNYEYAPVVLNGMKLVVTNTNKKHKLVGSAYNDRRRECEEAREILASVAGIKTLGDLSNEDFEKHKDAIKDPVVQKRAKHAVYENNRTLTAVAALKAGDIETFGKLMNASHVSLRDDFEVSCEELDILVEEAWKVPGVLGSRMTGGGFGGCTVSIVKDEAVEDFRKLVGEAYKKRVGYDCTFYVVSIGDGPQVI
ncbi:galactokinase [Oribacterium sp. KHPX15]|uniref:galactokinase n=1 Tax=Oribacterium sp. KHPX15 TaxID=1855342 RepID=UPI00089D572F|nr:galactokinase [Oribacterium sp. KHPX15]SEA53017.1 galactokinase [Oribacterium sp. KHPX15]